jgi:transglutaminase-like putative cysteine protease
MIYDIRQSTIYRYASSVAYARHVLRLTPIDRAGQRVHTAALDIEPAPRLRREGQDFFGNRLTWIELDESHQSLSVRVAARVAVTRGRALESDRTLAWEKIREAAFSAGDLSASSPAHFLFASRQVSLDPEIRAYAAASFLPGRPLVEAATDLMRRIKTEFVYEIGATTASTTPPMSFALRRGVCQDFAHIMISGMRGLGLPAAYVSGYLRTAQRPDEEQLAGASAMHAWVLVWCGNEAGWCGLDPTNAIPAGDDHAVLAIGRDYADVAPIDGVVLASGRQKLEVSVNMTPAE